MSRADWPALRRITLDGYLDFLDDTYYVDPSTEEADQLRTTIFREFIRRHKTLEWIWFNNVWHHLRYSDCFPEDGPALRGFNPRMRTYWEQSQQIIPPYIANTLEYLEYSISDDIFTKIPSNASIPSLRILVFGKYSSVTPLELQECVDRFPNIQKISFTPSSGSEILLYLDTLSSWTNLTHLGFYIWRTEYYSKHALTVIGKMLPALQYLQVRNNQWYTF
ncbi:hypothetical protein M422DRAFT_247682 [Sphaerobolus stellatus SS14]|nr:hypothetical protein M422DRAFT_247682 [Sphaerobolus stellatus SS14]